MRQQVSLLAVTGLIACLGIARPTPMASSFDEGLTGVWRVVLRVEQSLDSSATRFSRVEGFVAITVHEPVKSDALLHIAQPSHYGVYALPLERIGIVYPRPTQGPILAAREELSDSVSIVLQPELPHGAIVMRGLRLGDTISGSWVLTGYVSPMSGSFSMRRVTEF